MFAHKLTDDAELRLLEPRHAEELFELVDRNRTHLRRWLFWVDGSKSPADTRAFIQQNLRQYADSGAITVGIWYKGRLAGAIAMDFVSAGCMDIGYWLSEDCQGKGLVTTACRELIEHAFTNLGVSRIEITMQPGNDRSRAVPERLGFTHEGTMRQKGADAEGGRHDLMMFSLLKDECGESGSHGQ